MLNCWPDSKGSRETRAAICQNDSKMHGSTSALRRSSDHNECIGSVFGRLWRALATFPRRSHRRRQHRIRTKGSVMGSDLMHPEHILYIFEDIENAAAGE